MSKSRQKTPISGIASSLGQKLFRSKENRRARRAVKQLLIHEKYEEMPHKKKYGNEWASPRDGKTWYGYLKYMKEWIEEFKKLMRK